MKKKKFKNEKIRITDSFIGHGGSEIDSNKRKFEQLKVGITERFLVELVKEYPRGMKTVRISGKFEQVPVRITGSLRYTVFHSNNHTTFHLW